MYPFTLQLWKYVSFSPYCQREVKLEKLQLYLPDSFKSFAADDITICSYVQTLRCSPLWNWFIQNACDFPTSGFVTLTNWILMYGLWYTLWGWQDYDTVNWFNSFSGRFVRWCDDASLIGRTLPLYRTLHKTLSLHRPLHRTLSLYRSRTLTLHLSDRALPDPTSLSQGEQEIGTSETLFLQFYSCNILFFELL